MANRFDQLIDRWDPVLKAAFLDAIYELRDNAQVNEIARLLEAGNFEAAVRAVGLDPVSFRGFDKAITDTFEAGGNYTAKLVPAIETADGFRATFRFNIKNPAAENWLSQQSSTKVTQIIDDQRSMIRDHLREGMAHGKNPRSVALDLVGRRATSGRREGGVIGLTSSQADWLRNYELELSSDNPRAALLRSLRDKRFDRTVIKAAENGEPVPAELKQKMLDAYKGRALRYRGETIGRTEAIASLHEAQQQSIEQAIASGAISRDQVQFIWNTARDSRVRDSHRPMNGDVVKMGELFQTGSGNFLEFPGDPSAPASETINCRCWREPKIDFLRGIQ